MSEVTTTKKKAASAVAAVGVAAALALGGTFAWQSISQTALNEASDVVNPGGRLHDDFNGENKDVYVENFTDVETGEDIFARIRLEEYFEIVMNQGTPAEKREVVVGERVAKMDESGDPVFDEDGNQVYENRGATFTGYSGDGAVDAAVDEDGASWWSWTTGGETVYMPTFNMNKDSLKADVNGNYDSVDAEGNRYADYHEYSDGETETGTEVYDADANSAEDDGVTTVEGVDHTAKATGYGELIGMDEWDGTAGPYWVYDEDGWVYWAAPIEPGTATGLLLDGIELSQVMDDSWYYAINVVAQFVTADDLGKTDGTGFYADGETVSSDALALLEKIGVNTEGPVMVDTLDELRAALAAGEDVAIDGVIETGVGDDAELSGFGGATADYVWTEGGVLEGGVLESTSGSSHTLFINNENNWPVDGDGANAATINGTGITSASRFAIYAQAVDAPITLNDMDIENSYGGGILAEYAQPVTLNNLSVYAGSLDDDYAWVNSAVAAGMGANVTINGGSYAGTNAVYLLSSGANVTINGGTFQGALTVENGALVINGGTFTVDPSDFVPSGYEVLKNADSTWTVKEEQNSASELDEVLYVYVTPDDMDITVAAQYGQEIRVVLKGFPEGVTFTDEIVSDGLDAGATEEYSQVYINYNVWSWRTEELMYERSLTAPLSGYDEGAAVKVELVNRISIVGTDVIANDADALLALLDADGTAIENLSGATFSVSPAGAGVLSAGSSVSGANMTFAPSEGFTGAVDLTVTYDGVNYRRSVLVIGSEEATAILLYHHDGLGWFLPHETIYKGQWYSYFLVVNGVFQDVALPDEGCGFTEDSNGWSLNDGVRTDSYYGWAGFTWDRQLAYAVPTEEEADTSTSLLIGYSAGDIAVSTVYDSVSTPEVTIAGDETELSISSGKTYSFTVSQVDPRDSTLRAYIYHSVASGYEDWEEYEYDCSFTVNEDNSATVTVDLSDWTYGPVDGAELVFHCFNDYHRLDVTIME